MFNVCTIEQFSHGWMQLQAKNHIFIFYAARVKEGESKAAVNCIHFFAPFDSSRAMSLCSISLTFSIYVLTAAHYHWCR